MKNKKIGYTSGVFDMFHVGHLNIIKKARKNCDYLIVAVSSDELSKKLKNKKPLISFQNRIKIIKSLIYVDKAVKEKKDDKISAWRKYKYNIIFKGSDWKNSKKMEKIKQIFFK